MSLVPNVPPQVKREVDLVEQAIGLHRVKRFFHQRFFEAEARDAEYASRVEPGFRLESVSEHSWHVADTVLLVACSFPALDLPRATQLAVVHDKMELFIGDIDPIGRDGTGRRSHAFSPVAKERKTQRELEALDAYLDTLPLPARSMQMDLYAEALACHTPEAKLVKSVDKLVALIFVLVKKAGRYEDKHLRLLLSLTERNAALFAGLSPHHWEVLDRIVTSAAKRRGMSTEQVLDCIQGSQIRLF